MQVSDFLLLAWEILCAIALRYLLFEHGTLKAFRDNCALIFAKLEIPEYWEALKKCPFCNGFWASLIVHLVFAWAFSSKELGFTCLPFFGIVGGYICLVAESVVAPTLDKFEIEKIRKSST